jgi:hypothetical protein
MRGQNRHFGVVPDGECSTGKFLRRRLGVVAIER